MREILISTLLHHPFLFKGKTNASSRSSRKDFWRRYRGDLRQVNTYQVPIINCHLLHYIIRHLPLVFLSPSSPLLFYSPSLYLSSLSFSICLFLPVCFLFACVLVCLLVVMASLISSPLSPENEVLNFKQRGGENLKDA